MKILLLISLLTMPLSGFTQRPLTFLRSNIKANKILLLPPATYISFISNGSIQQIDSGLTQETYRYTLKQLQKSFPDSIKTNIYSADSGTMVKLISFVSKLNKKIQKERQIKNYKLPDSILQIFDTSEINYVFCTYNIGFKRTKINLVNTHLTMEITDILLGHNLRPLESATLISCFIIDLRAKNILYFERDIWKNSDPTDFKVIKLMLTKIITHYFI